VLATLIIGSNAWAMVPDLMTHDVEPDYYFFVIPFVWQCDIDEYPQTFGYMRNPLKWWLSCLSYQLTSSPKTFLLPFAIGLMPLVYFLGKYLTHDKLIALIAVVAFTYNPLYTDWATNGTYDQVWAFFLLLSFVLLLKNRSGYSISVYVVSLFAKVFSILYLPIWCYIAIKQKQFIPILVWGGLVIVSIIVILHLDMVQNIMGNEIGFYPEHLDQAIFRNISLFWQVIPFMLALLGVNFVFAPKQRTKGRTTVILFILWTFALTPIIHLFSEQLTFSYRYAAMAAFMSVFAGIVIVEIGNFVVESKLKIAKPH